MTDKFDKGDSEVIIDFLNEMISEKHSSSTSRALQERRENGLPVGPTPYGYDVEDGALVPNHDEQGVIRMIKNLNNGHYSLREIAELLSAKGIPAKRGGRWYASTVRNIINSRVYGDWVDLEASPAFCPFCLSPMLAHVADWKITDPDEGDADPVVGREFICRNESCGRSFWA
jgi:hypothetical protein